MGKIQKMRIRSLKQGNYGNSFTSNVLYCNIKLNVAKFVHAVMEKIRRLLRNDISYQQDCPGTM